MKKIIIVSTVFFIALLITSMFFVPADITYRGRVTNISTGEIDYPIVESDYALVSLWTPEKEMFTEAKFLHFGTDNQKVYIVVERNIRESVVIVEILVLAFIYLSLILSIKWYRDSN